MDSFNTSEVHLKTKIYPDNIQKALNTAAEKALKNVTNRILQVTLPNTATRKERAESASKNLNKKAVNALKKRIKYNIIGDGREGSGLRTATPAGDGGFIVEDNDKGYMPFVVMKTQRGRKKKKSNKIIKLNNFKASGAELLKHILANTRMTVKNNKAIRVIRKGAKIAWSTKAAAKEAAELLAKRAGNLLSGWKRLAAITKVTKINSLTSGGTHSDRGEATLRKTDDSVRLTASNDEVPQFKEKYQSAMIDNNIAHWVKWALQNELKYALKSLNKKKRK